MRLLILLVLLVSALPSCTTTKKSASLSEFQSYKWSEMDKSAVKRSFGEPDTQGVIDTSEHALVYLNKGSNSPRLIVTYDTQSQKVLSSHWFADNPSQKLTFSDVKNHFSDLTFNTDFVRGNNGWGRSTDIYMSQDKHIRIMMDTDTKKLNALSWQLDPNPKLEKRRPTSH